jgi:predicted SAM-dependent methyltransferase
MVLEIGCGNNPITESTPDIQTKLVDYRMDVVRHDPVNVLGNTIQLPFVSGSFDAIVCQHVLEHHTHCSFGENPTYGTLLVFLKEIHRVLGEDGYFESICPNFAFIAIRYIESYKNVEAKMELMAWAMGGQRDEWDHHGVLLDAQILWKYAQMAGFSDMELLHPFDWFGLHIKLLK